MSDLRMRADLEALPNYKPGQAPKQLNPELVRYKVSANENPFPPLPSVRNAVANTLEGFNRYPDSSGADLASRLAQRYSVDPMNIALGSGSVEIVSQMIRAVADPGSEILFAWRSFEAYPLLVTAASATPIMVPLNDEHAHDFDAMLAAITDKTRLIIVCNPNNPTGTCITEEQLEAFMSNVPSDITVLIDEAYEHFNTRTDSPIGIDFFRKYPNVAVAHTFSKAYGLAGLRVGYAIVPEQLGQAMRKVSLPFGVTTLAQFAAAASLDAEEELQERVNHLIDERERVVASLTALGWDLTETQANFLWFPLGESSTKAAQVFESHGLSVRPYAGEGVRVTIDSDEANDRIVQVAEILVKQGLDNRLVTQLVKMQ